MVSCPAVASIRPSGEKATQLAPRVCPRSTRRSRPVRASHSRTSGSSLTVARRRPPGEKANPLTGRGWSRVTFSFPVRASHKWTRTPRALARTGLSGANSTSRSAATARAFPLFKSQSSAPVGTMTVGLRLPVARRVPSGEKATSRPPGTVYDAAPISGQSEPASRAAQSSLRGWKRQDMLIRLSGPTTEGLPRLERCMQTRMDFRRRLPMKGAAVPIAQHKFSGTSTPLSSSVTPLRQVRAGCALRHPTPYTLHPTPGARGAMSWNWSVGFFSRV